MSLVLINRETDIKLGTSVLTGGATTASLVRRYTGSLDLMDSGCTHGRALCIAQAGNITRAAHSVEEYSALRTDNRSLMDLDQTDDVADEDDDDEAKLELSALQFDLVSFAGAPEDDELTSLAWLQDANLLRNITAPGYVDSPSKENHGMLSLDAYEGQLSKAGYNPVSNRSEKPPYSFSCLIFMAIEESQTKRLPVNDIYNWISSHFPFFKTAPVGWRNSVRHNLSLNKCFRKVEKICEEGVGKGSSWCVDPLYRPNLLQALKRTPYHPYLQLQMTHSTSSASTSPRSDSSLSSTALDSGDDLSTEDVETSVYHDRLNQIVPLRNLRRSKCSSKISSVTSADDLDVANTLASLSKVITVDPSLVSESPDDRSRRNVVVGLSRLESLCKFSGLAELVCTPIPSDDHAYTIPASLLDEAKLASTQHNQNSSDGDAPVVEALDDLNDKLMDAKDDKNNNFKRNNKNNLKLAAIKYNTKTKKVSNNKKLNCQLTSGSRANVGRRKNKVNHVKYGVKSDNQDELEVEDICEMLEISQVVREKCAEEEDDETRRLHEGVHALLNLASSAARHGIRRSDGNVPGAAFRTNSEEDVQNTNTAKTGLKKHEESKMPCKLNLKKKNGRNVKKTLVKKSEMSLQLLASAISKKKSVKIVGKKNTTMKNVYNQNKYNTAPCVPKRPKKMDVSKAVRTHRKSLRFKTSQAKGQTAPLQRKQPRDESKFKVLKSKRIKLAASESHFRRSCRIRTQD